MKNIQSLTLMMAVMVYAAPTTTPAPTTPSKEILLKAIHETAENLYNKSLKELHFQVPGVIRDGFPTCTEEFFCLAEKALNKTSTQRHIANLTGTVARNVTKLIRELHQYNNLTIVNCHLDPTWGKRSMKRFLADIKHCSAQ